MKNVQCNTLKTALNYVQSTKSPAPHKFNFNVKESVTRTYEHAVAAYC